VEIPAGCGKSSHKLCGDIWGGYDQDDGGGKLWWIDQIPALTKDMANSVFRNSGSVILTAGRFLPASRA
jgi:hypothetical protein